MGNSGKCLICGKTVANISKHSHNPYSYSAPRADKKNFFPGKSLSETSGVADETAENTAAVQDAVAVQDVAAAKNYIRGSSREFGGVKNRWVKYRICEFCKFVRLPLDCHQRLVIVMLLHIERDMAAAKVSKGDEGTIRRKVRAKSKGERESRNLISMGNNDGK
nr:hypothetical protein CFP56_56099 [Quercus suber]